MLHATLKLRHRPSSYLQPLSIFPFFLMAVFNLINGYGHKSSKLEDVSSLKEMRNKWNGTRAVFSSAYGLR
jgi:hypothetical protein